MASSYELPPPRVERIGRFRVVRDDDLPGGSKMRYMLPLIAASKASTFVYASPAVGYAQIALAHSCRLLGRQAVVFVAKRKQPHPRTLAAKAAGAVVYQVPCGYLTVVQARARRYAEDHGATLIPWGVDMPEALAHFAAAGFVNGAEQDETLATWEPSIDRPPAFRPDLLMLPAPRRHPWYDAEFNDDIADVIAAERGRFSTVNRKK